MRILAIETVDTTGSVALLNDGAVVAERTLGNERRSAQTLAPSIHELLTAAGWSTTQIELVCVATGPGSFTGLRIGVTTAKTLAYTIGAQVAGVHTLAAIASQAPQEVRELQVVLDAGRGELYAAKFLRGGDGTLAEQETTRIIVAEAWLAGLSSGQHVSGSGLERLLDALPAGVIALDRELWRPTAVSVGQLGYRLYQAGQRDNTFDLVPQYFRRTAAEEQWERRGKV